MVGLPAGPLTTRASQVESQALRWAWDGRLLLGYLAVQTGLEGLGKSAFACWMIARLTRGELDGEFTGAPVDVLVVAGEDGIRDMWKPRLVAADADLERVHFLALDALPDDWNVRDGIDQLRDAVDGARVLFVDALLDHMPAPRGGESINNPTFVRAALGPLKRLVRELDVAGLFSMHPPKARASSFRELVQASQAFGAIPRVGLLLAYHPDDAELREQGRRRVLIRGKGNAGIDPGALEFHIVGRALRHDDGRTADVPVVVNVRPCGLTLADLLGEAVVGARQPTKHDRATRMIGDLLRDGRWHESQPIIDALRAVDISYDTTNRASKDIDGLRRRKRPGVDDGPWEWRLEDPQAGESCDLPNFDSSRARDDCRSSNFPSPLSEKTVGKGSSEDGRGSGSDPPDEGKIASDETRRAYARTREAPWGPGSLADAARRAKGGR
jgi:hypothetical protein